MFVPAEGPHTMSVACAISAQILALHGALSKGGIDKANSGNMIRTFARRVGRAVSDNFPPAYHSGYVPLPKDLSR